MSRREQDAQLDAAFTEFVAARRRTLFGTAYLLTGGDREHAEDIVQSTLVKLYVRWRRLHGRVDIGAYARRAIINTHIDQARQRWHREVPGLDLIDHPAEPEPAREDNDELWAALRRLSPKQRRIVILRHYWGLSVQEVADDLGVSTGTVKSQTSAALSILRGVLLLEDNPSRGDKKAR